jgi:hypothetical protein
MINVNCMLLGPLSHSSVCVCGSACAAVFVWVQWCRTRGALLLDTLSSRASPLLTLLPFERVGFLLAGGRAWNPGPGQKHCAVLCALHALGIRLVGCFLIERARAWMYLGHGALSFGVQSTIRGVIKAGFPASNSLFSPLAVVAFCPFCLQAAKTFSYGLLFAAFL